MSAPGSTLTAADPEPPPGTLVRDDCGVQWVNDGNYPSAWVNPDDDGYGRARTWTKIAGNYGPVTVLEWGESLVTATSGMSYGTLPDDQLVQVVAAIVDPTGQTEDAVERAQNIIRLVRANTTCLGDMRRGCY